MKELRSYKSGIDQFSVSRPYTYLRPCNNDL